MKFIRVAVSALFLASPFPAYAVDANSLINGTLRDWFYAKSDITMQAAQLMITRDRKAGVSVMDLWQCINEVAVDGDGSTGSQKVAQIAALCMVTMNGGH